MDNRHGPATPVELSDEDRATLQTWARREDFYAVSLGRQQVSRIVLACADGGSNQQVATRVGMTWTTVRDWRLRFAEHGLDAIRGRGGT